ncbi:hypothetical protein [Halopelagius longus]|uniref:Fenitrothion hydrolase n=1 Tax=Halopelagius longus TaxID=1236180 RepID=A0A1H1DNN5_9EURY|nr:hypothetical protein [Halopelagius longus]RDI71398.1 hypothetical protein DWB78_06475 [Halopelagius longus]SDQ77869.1 hypothetical protein SAMN05216278_2493 [Halopelagius longus]
MSTGRRLRTRTGATTGARTVARTLLVAVVLSLAARPVAAHQFSSRFDAPIPLELLYGGAAVAVGATAVLLAAVDETPTLRRRLFAVPRSVGRAASAAARAAFFLAFVGVLVAGLVGPRAAAENFATLFTWSIWVKGVGLVAIAAGSPWWALSPWRTLYDALCRLEGGEIRLRAYPAGLGHWPALAWFVVLVGVAENLTQVPQLPTATAVVVAVYALVTLAGALLFGREWFERGDVFEVLYDLLGRTAPLSATPRDGGGWVVGLRAPWRDCSAPLSTRTLTAFVVAMVYTVTFDGFAESPLYQSLYFGVREAFGVGPSVSVVLYEAGLFGFLLAYVLVVVAVDRLTRLARGRSGSEGDGSRGDPEAKADGGGGRASDSVSPPPSAALAFGGTLLPIAAGYEVAHNYAFVATYVGRLPTLAGFDSADPLWWLSIPAFWISQVVLIVAGHVVAVVAADAAVRRRLTVGRIQSGDGTRRRAPSKRWALLAHAPLVALMVGYTALSLWVVSLPVAG